MRACRASSSDLSAGFALSHQGRCAGLRCRAPCL